MTKHLNAKAAVQVSDPPFPGAPNNLRCKASSDPRLAHDMVGELPCSVEELVSGHNLVYHSIFESHFGVDRLSGEQNICGPLDAQQFLKTTVDTISRN